MDFDPDDRPSNPSTTTPFADLVAERVARRTVLKGGSASALLAFLTASPTAAFADDRDEDTRDDDDDTDDGRGGLLGFAPVPLSGADRVVVPEGYAYDVILPWGDPVQPDGPAWKADASNSAAEQAEQLGMGHDGMHLFALDDDRALLVLNHEYTIDEQLFPYPGGPYVETAPGEFTPENWTSEHTEKSMAAHGLSVVEIARDDEDGPWRQVRSRYARRVTASTPMAISGPAAEHRLLTTEVAGRRILGTLNNCSSGKTPWGTYLAAEENFNGYFNVASEAGKTDEQRELIARYGLGGSWYEWWRTHDRFDADRYPNEPNKYGWMVELDPQRPDEAPVKRTALGRFKHEGAVITTGRGGRAVVYMGDDERGDYIYKFVSARSWRSMIARGQSPLDEGTLYVARYDADGTGVWLPLTVDDPVLAEAFADQGELLVKTRLAADLVGATPMDRPEWAAVDPRTGDVYCTLTNNKNRGVEPDQPVDAANPRKRNPWGHIIRWTERHADATATSFRWDIFLLAGPGDGVDGSTIDSDDAFGSPDGLGFDRDGRLWIMTDGKQPGGGNDQVLVADPRTGEIRRFLTGVGGCEVTGLTFAPEGDTVFVNIQHPGDDGTPADPDSQSTFPFDQGRPRPATVAVRRLGGGTIAG